jgi:hypothetical protein
MPTTGKGWHRAPPPRFRQLVAGEEAFEIHVPVLTEKEIAYLETELVGAAAPLPRIKGVPAADIKAFAQVYRWRVGAR